ncbi:MAG TPA: hypothetical protein VF627_09775 [Abditibacterium sp.]|jgi:uncharacterized protein YycO
MIPLSFTKRRRALARPNGPKPGDILLFSHAKGLNRLVTWFSHSRYYHCSIYEGQGHSIEARPEGVVRRDLMKDSGAVFRVIPMPESASEQVVEYARGCLGKHYSVLDVFLIIWRQLFPRFRVPIVNDNSLICSEMICLAWRRAGLDLFPGHDASTLLPTDFERFLPPDSRDETLSH